MDRILWAALPISGLTFLWLAIKFMVRRSNGMNAPATSVIATGAVLVAVLIATFAVS